MSRDRTEEIFIIGKHAPPDVPPDVFVLSTGQRMMAMERGLLPGDKVSVVRREVVRDGATDHIEVDWDDRREATLMDYGVGPCFKIANMWT